MRRANHLLMGCISSVLTGSALLPTLIGSIAPDIDLMWRKKGNTLFTAHRGITHHLLLGIFMLVFSYLSQNVIFLSFSIGYLSHLLSDMLTISGIPYWKNSNRIALKLFRTGKIGEDIFSYSLLTTLLVVKITKGGIEEIIPPEVYFLVHLLKEVLHI